MHRRRPSVAAALGLSLIVAVCGACNQAPHRRAGPTPTTTTTGLSSAAFSPGATATIGLAGSPTNWNPLASGPSSSDPSLQAVADAVLPSVFVVGSGDTPTLDTNLVDSARQTASDPQQVTYTIDPRAHWSDGTPVTVADFVYTWEAQSGDRHYRDRGRAAFTPASTAGYSDISSVGPGPQPGQVVVRFRAEDPDWAALFSPLLPATRALQVGFDHGFTDPVTDLLSAGPFVVTAYQPGVDVVLARNPGWWGHPAGLALVTVDFVDSPDVATASLLSSQLDAAVEPFVPAELHALATNTGLSATAFQTATYDDLVFDTAAVPLPLRQALAAAVDRAGLASEARAEGDAGAAPVDNRALLPGQAGYVAHGPVAGGTAAAGRLLVEAGYQGVGTALTRGGRRVRLTLAVHDGSPFASMETSAITAAASALGVTLQPVSGSDADLVLRPRSVRSFPSELAADYDGTPELAGLLGAADDLADGPERRAALADFDDAAAARAVDLPLLFQPAVLAYQTRYRGIGPVAGGDGVAWDIGAWGIPIPS